MPEMCFGGVGYRDAGAEGSGLVASDEDGSVLDRLARSGPATRCPG